MTVQFGKFALYFSGPDQLQLDNLERLESAVAEASNRVRARMLDKVTE